MSNDRADAGYRNALEPGRHPRSGTRSEEQFIIIAAMQSKLEVDWGVSEDGPGDMNFFELGADGRFIADVSQVSG